jgi:hypothetical protein
VAAGWFLVNVRSFRGCDPAGWPTHSGWRGGNQISALAVGGLRSTFFIPIG